MVGICNLDLNNKNSIGG